MKHLITWPAYLAYLLIFTFVFITGVVSAKPVKGDEKIIAMVNGTPLYEKRLKEGLNSHNKKFSKSVLAVEKINFSDPATKVVLYKIIDQMLLTEASQAETIHDIDKRVETALAAKKAQAHSEERFASYLKSKKMTVETYRQYLARKIHMDEYMKRQGITTAEIPEHEIRKFYNKGDGLKQEESVKVRHILVSVEKESSSKEKEKRRLTAEEILNKIHNGEDFAELARHKSECKRSNESGGDLGYIKRGYMPSTFEEVAFSLSVGATSDVIESEFGYHILQVMDKRKAGRKTYEETREFLKKYLQERQIPLLLDKHIAELRDKADIQLFLN